MRARHVRHLRGRGCRHKHLKQVLNYAKRLLRLGGMERLADFDDALSAARPPFAGPSDRVLGTTPTLRTLKRDLTRADISLNDENDRSEDRHAVT